MQGARHFACKLRNASETRDWAALTVAHYTMPPPPSTSLACCQPYSHPTTTTTKACNCVHSCRSCKHKQSCKQQHTRCSTRPHVVTRRQPTSIPTCCSTIQPIHPGPHPPFALRHPPPPMPPAPPPCNNEHGVKTSQNSTPSAYRHHEAVAANCMLP